ncbi:MAG TPA: type II secretion system protein [Acidimicrobiia bacterium]|jgi:type IV pilus assembly protein PilA
MDDRCQGERPGSEGFTLVELMTVVLIIAILIAIAIPTFFGARDRAADREAQSLDRDALVAGKVVFTDSDTYVGITTADLQQAETELKFVAAATPALARLKQVSVASGNTGGQSYLLAVTGASSGRCFAALALSNSPTAYQELTLPTCSASGFDPTVGPWLDSWP